MIGAPVHRRAIGRAAPLAVVVLLAAACYAPSWDNALVYDDAALVGGDPRVVEPGRLGEICSRA